MQEGPALNSSADSDENLLKLLMAFLYSSLMHLLTLSDILLWHCLHVRVVKADSLFPIV